MRDITRSAEKRVNSLEAQAREQFESSIVHNRVSVAVQEDDAVRHTVDVAERAYELNERNDLPEEMELVPFGAAEDINDHVDTLVEMAVARECANVIEAARDGWFDDHAEDEEIEAAFQEACTWLVEHRDAACGADLDVDALVWNESDDGQEVSADV